MPYSGSPIVGTIAMEPVLALTSAVRPWLADDSSLEGLLTSLAHCASLNSPAPDAAAEERPPCLVASTRLSLPTADVVQYDAIRADVARLVADLEDEYALVKAR